MNRTDILNTLAKEFHLQNYLEIGTQFRDANFNKINCVNKICVDPDPKAKADYICTSDKFFDIFLNGPAQKGVNIDLIFIDGLHHADQVKKDFENALDCLSENGFIMIHDTLPTEEKYTTVPRETNRWYGDVYKLLCILKFYEGIEFVNIEADCGCCIVWKKQNYKKENNIGDKLINAITWQGYLKLKPFIPAMKLCITPEKITSMIKEARLLSI